MKKQSIFALAVSACTLLLFTSCQSDKPEYVKLFRVVINDEMLCPPDGNNCAYVNGRHIFKGDQDEAQDNFEPATRQMLNTFYCDVAQNNVKRFFEEENWQTLFSTELLNPTILGEIANANYATIIVPGDSSIMFVHKQEGGMEAENLIYAFKRTDVKRPIINDTIVP